MTIELFESAQRLGRRSKEVEPSEKRMLVCLVEDFGNMMLLV